MTSTIAVDSKVTGTAVRHFDVSLDDRRFLMTLLPDDAPDKPVSDMTIVVNWLDELHARER